MVLGPASYGFAFAAGLLATLSPCVLPVLPILIASAVQAHPRAPLALAAGVALSYAGAGTALARASALWGIEPGPMRMGAALLLGAAGATLVVPRLHRAFAAAVAGVAGLGSRWSAVFQPTGLGGHFVLGLILGVIWTPCVGPTLGAAIVVASQGQQLVQVFFMLTLFGTGAALPLLALSFLSRTTAQRLRGDWLRAGALGRGVLGVMLMGVSLLVLTGRDKALEQAFLEWAPDWMVALTTRY